LVDASARRAFENLQNDQKLIGQPTIAKPLTTRSKQLNKINTMRQLLLMIVCCAWTIHLSAQKLSIGVSGGATYNLFTTDMPPDPSCDYVYPQFNIHAAETGWRLEVPVEYQIIPALAVRLEAGMQQRAGRTYLNNTNELGEPIAPNWMKHSFLSFDGALLVKISPIPKYRHAYVVAGASYSKIVGYKQNWYDVTTGTDVRTDRSLEDVNVHQRFAELGLGWQTNPTKRHGGFAEVRYQHGLNNIAAPWRGDQDVSTIAFNAGYMWAF
jgi:Outer membrane protein beta-barrel domain